MTPDQIAAQRRVAAGLMQQDYSPVASPWQGLARVAGNVTGALQQRSADKASAANAAESNAVLQALLGAQTPDKMALGAAMSNPNIGEDVRGYAGSQLAALSKPAPINDTVQDYNFRSQMLGEQAAKDWLAHAGDPIITTTLPGGDFYSGPQSGLAARMAGGGLPPQQPPQIPGRPPIGTVVPDPFGDGGPSPQAMATFPGPIQGTGRGY